MKKCLTSIVVRKMQIKTTTLNYLDIGLFDWNVEQRALLYTAVGIS